LSFLESHLNGSFYVNIDIGDPSNKEKYFKVSVIKLFDASGKYTGAVLGISPAPEIAEIMGAFKGELIIFTVLTVLVGIFAYLYFKEFSLTRKKHKKIELITSTMASGLYVMDSNGVITFVNDAATQILGFSKEEMLGKVAHDLFHKHKGPLKEWPLYTVIKNGTDYCGDDTFMRKDGSLVDVHVCSKPLLENHKAISAVVVFQNITERKRMEQELYRMAITDSLTGLYNRRFQIGMIKDAIHTANRYNIPFCIAILDIDWFKSINDTYGHEMGDMVLVKIAECLKENTRSTDIVARWGGEEFLILLRKTTLEGALKLAEKLRKEMQKIVIHPIPPITISIGLAEYNKNESLNDVVARADDALYEAKAEGKNRVKYR
jgi:diguanylate cyclase (GGDEF)-like protein/PAS domain S-box-containing protein